MYLTMQYNSSADLSKEISLLCRNMWTLTKKQLIVFKFESRVCTAKQTLTHYWSKDRRIKLAHTAQPDTIQSLPSLSLTQSPLCFMNTGRARPASRTQDPTDTFTSDMPCSERDETGFQVSQAYIIFMIHAKYVLQVIAKIKIHILYGLFAS